MLSLKHTAHRFELENITILTTKITLVNSNQKQLNNEKILLRHFHSPQMLANI